jgi:hypothetical protein
MQYFYIAFLVIQIVGPIIFYAVRLLGFGLITYVGINVAMDQVLNYITNYMIVLPLYLQQILGLAKLDVVANIYFSAVTARMLIAGYNAATSGGSKKKWATLTA